MSRFVSSLVRLRPKWTQDRQGSTVADWSDPDRELYPYSCSITPAAPSTEQGGDGRLQVISMYELHSRPGVQIDLLPTDRVEWQGQALEVVGEVRAWPHPIKPGQIHHIECALRKVTG